MVSWTELLSSFILLCLPNGPFELANIEYDWAYFSSTIQNGANVVIILATFETSKGLVRVLIFNLMSKKKIVICEKHLRISKSGKFEHKRMKRTIIWLLALKRAKNFTKNVWLHWGDKCPLQPYTLCKISTHLKAFNSGSC